jgi:hypothetical protein
VCSCDWESDKTEKIEVVNQTGEDVIIYYHTFHNRESTLARITPYDEFTRRFVWVSPGTKYYARGKASNKDYGERTFAAVPSYIHDQQTWVIRDN